MTDRTYRHVNRVFRCVFAALGLRPDVEGSEHVPAAGPVILASNHTSYLDFAMVGLVAERRGRLVRFMAKKAVFDAPASGHWMRAMGHIPVDRAHGAGAYLQARRRLWAGEAVGIFPEGTISRSFTLKKRLRPGAVALAADTGAPVVPVVSWGAHRLLTVGGRGRLRRHVPVTVVVGEPFHVAPDADLAEANLALARRLEAMLDLVQRTYPELPSGAADRWWQPAHLGGSAPPPALGAVLDDVALRRKLAVAAAGPTGSTGARPPAARGASVSLRPARRPARRRGPLTLPTLAGGAAAALAALVLGALAAVRAR